MGLLTDTDLRKIIFKGETSQWPDNKLQIYPYNESCITPVGYDLRVGSKYASSIDAKLYTIKDTDDNDGNNKVRIKPGDTVLITSLERIGMPQDYTISAFITSKVSKVSQGLAHISTNIDPDWQGNLLIALHNPSRKTVELEYGEPFCTINFIKNLQPSTLRSGKPENRSDILLDKFYEDVQIARETALKKFKVEWWKKLALRTLVIFSFTVFGYLRWEATAGFPAMVALGAALASYIEIPKIDDYV